MCWYITTSPPLPGSKNDMCMVWSNITMNCEAATNGVPSTTRAEVVRLAHTISGMRHSVMPGARIVRIVTMKFTAVRIEEVPAHCTPMLKKIWLSDSYSEESGAYAVQPAPNPDISRLASMMMPPMGSIQKE